MRTIYLVLFVMIPFFSGAQKLKSDGFKINLEEHAIQNQGFCGKKNEALVGRLSVKGAKEFNGTYILSITKTPDGVSMVMIKGNDNKVVNPMMLYNEETKTVYTLKDRVKDKEYVFQGEISNQDLLLNCMLFWLKVKTGK